MMNRTTKPKKKLKQVDFYKELTKLNCQINLKILQIYI